MHGTELVYYDMNTGNLVRIERTLVTRNTIFMDP